jgi:hypothetical protein
VLCVMLAAPPVVTPGLVAAACAPAGHESQNIIAVNDQVALRAIVSTPFAIPRRCDQHASHSKGAVLLYAA